MGLKKINVVHRILYSFFILVAGYGILQKLLVISAAIDIAETNDISFERPNMVRVTL